MTDAPQATASPSPPHHVLIRPAAQTDAPELARVHVASWRAAYRGILPDTLLDGLSPEAYEARWRRILEQETRPTLVGDADGRLTGFVSVGPNRDEDAAPPRTGELYALYLDPRVWGRGMGYALWNAALRMLLEEGFTEATLWVLEGNVRARSFYERVGFCLEPGAVKTLERHGAVVREVRYRRPLA